LFGTISCLEFLVEDAERKYPGAFRYFSIVQSKLFAVAGVRSGFALLPGCYPVDGLDNVDLIEAWPSEVDDQVARVMSFG